MSLDQHSGEPQTGAAVDARMIDGALKGLWDRVRRTGEAIAQLREANQSLAARLKELEIELERLQTDGQEKDQRIHTLTQELEKARKTDGAVLSNGEREQLGARARELLQKLEGYL